MIEKLKKCICQPEYLLHALGRRNLLDWMSDERYLTTSYRLTFGKKPNLDNPVTYSEKLQWLKLYDRNPDYVDMVDKKKVKSLVAELIGEEYVVPTLGTWEKAEDINFSILPDRFVLKCNHDSGGIVICKDKTKLDEKKAIDKLSKCLKHNGYWYGREWPYKNVEPCIIAEPYLEDTITQELPDYKFFVFSGKVRAMFIATERFSSKEETKFDFYDDQFNHLPFVQGHPNSNKPIIKPNSFDKMKELAEIIAKDLVHARVDFYEVDGRIYFGEITFFHFSGLQPFEPEEWDERFGSWIKLPEVNKRWV